MQCSLSAWPFILGLCPFPSRTEIPYRFLETFNYVMHHREWNIQIPSHLSLRNTVSTLFNYFLMHLLAKWQCMVHLCTWRTRLFLDAAFVSNHDYKHLLTSAVSIHSLIQISRLWSVQNCPLPNFFGICCRPQWNIYQEDKLDQTKY